MIKSAIEKLFDVKIKTVRTHIVKYAVGGTMQRRRLAQPKIKKEKRAMVTLAEGYSLIYLSKQNQQRQHLNRQENNKLDRNHH